MPIYEINGSQIQTEAPLSDEEIDEIASSIGPAKQEAPKPPVEPQNQSLADVAGEVGKGLLSGAADIGNAMINGITYIPRKLSDAVAQPTIEDLIAGRSPESELSRWNRVRQESLGDFNKDNEDNTSFALGRIGSNIAGTAGVGSLLGAGAAAANLPRLARALETGGFASLG